ncbi:MAG: hypothetical protein IKJ30_04845 [Bacilli bacterium]|nr:hypothetical protein [Bacilli bacterium]
MAHIVDYDDYFEEYMGKVYSRIIKSNNLNNLNSVVEFAPGFRYKIAYALRNVNFNGTIYIVDSNESVLNFVGEKYKEILKDAKVVTIQSDLIESVNMLPNNVDLFLANHCVDDMIVSKYLEEKKLEDAFNNTSDSKGILLNCWEELKENDRILSFLHKKVYEQIMTFFLKINPKFIIMSQYKSAYYMKQKNYIEELSKEVFDRLKKHIDTDVLKLKSALDFDFEDFDAALNEGFSLKENIQYYDNWIAGRIRDLGDEY